jgi:pyruvate/2-oxoglutarate dehydrogenase complex dihydrolipoamide dehydrogenase (E3) component
VKYDYDVIVIGGGAAGLVASKFAAGVGKRVALVEKSRLGGECTLYGCVPSKTLIRIARLFREMNSPEILGLQGNCSVAAGPAVFDRVRAVVSRVYEGHKPDILEGQGVEVIFGDPRFCGPSEIDVDGKVLSAKSFVVCTGSSAFVPPIPGLDSVPYLTNQTLFDLTVVPHSLIVLGGGPIGIEMAQAFSCLGCAVTLVEMAPQILAREEKELADMLALRMAESGTTLMTGTKAVSVRNGSSGIELTVERRSGDRTVVVADSILVAVGRKANVEGLDLEAAGVGYSPKGVTVDRGLRTSASTIYAAGDVAGPYQFSHMAEYQARIAARNALYPVKSRVDYGDYIWCTFTDPEFAHLGLTEEEARRERGDRIRIYRWNYRDTDRGRTDGEEFGMAKFVCDESYGLLGAHILGARAGELIHEAQIIRSLGIPFYKLDSMIHIYPTFADVVRQPAKMAHIEKVRNNPFVKMITGIAKKR